ncbi:flagellar basal-body rod protein FlgF [Eubacterium sp. MSJ-13]|uniref:flagellar basal-body rod protein FlgF n=1 Tax=Eubacterium sp. MSJ-13 TaxID=2841513 RepID=UPI001C127ABF|nr:flagellar basal-body rod protein FlgF [Eubacterium sp. MSJ-13]MBU5478219.1 flagellar basal-body rod protein FlgF [Eubacterium sp. MSJ-13]
MVRGLYTAYTGMVNEQKRLDIISNNLANSATVGYKEENVTSRSFADLMMTKIKDGSEAFVDRGIGVSNPGVALGETYMNWDQGSLRETDNTYDMAIQGDGFFAIKVEDANGNSSIKYTRNGQFSITSDGYVVDVDGNRLQGANGDVQVPVDSTDIAIKQNGAIFADGTQVDTITLTDFSDYNYLELYGDNMYTAVDGATTKDTSATILQGFTEQSNVNVVDEMVSMITITRAYEAGQKMIRTQDSLLEQAVSSVGKV